MNLRHVTVDDYWPFCRQLYKYFKDIIILDENKVTSGIARTFLEHDIECHVEYFFLVQLKRPVAFHKNDQQKQNT